MEYLENLVREQDTYKFQVNRLEKLLGERSPGTEITFDESNTLIRFRVRDVATGTELVGTSGEWFPHELAENSDDVLWETICQLSNGKLSVCKEKSANG